MIASVIWKYQAVLLDEDRYLRLITAALIFLSLAVAAYALILHNGGAIETKYAVDCCKAAGAGFGFSVGYYIEHTRLNFDAHAGGFAARCFRLVIGLLLALLIKEGFSLVFGNSVLAKMSEYFILVLWVLVLYPYLFLRIKYPAAN